MAYTSSRKTTEHSYKVFTRTLASGVFPSVMLLCGAEAFLTDWARKAIINKLVNPVAAQLDSVIFQEDETSVSDIIAACETVPMFSEKKVVTVDFPQLFGSTEKKSDFSASDIEDLAEYVSSVPESTLLLFVADKADKRKVLYKKIEKCGLVYDFTALDEPTLTGWVSKRLALAGFTAKNSDIVRFATEAGYFDKERSYGLYNLDNDIKKACALASNKTLGYADFAAVSSGEAETAAFKLLDCAFAGKKGEALKLLHSSIAAEIPSKQTGVILRFHGLLCSQLEIMLEAAERKEQGQTSSEIKQGMGINPYRLEKAIKASAGLTVTKLRRALAAAYAIEKDLKSGRMDGRLAMELFIAKI